MLFRTLNALFLVAYLLSAAVQFNDPDPIAWVVIYSAAAGLCVARFVRRQRQWLAALLCCASLIWIGTLLPAVLGQVSPADVVESISMQTRAVEEAREIGGLMMIALWSGLLLTPWGRSA